MAVQVFSAEEEGWTIQGAEDLLSSLTGVYSVRLVARPGGEIEEIHLLTSDEISPKQTVRNVESALLAHYDLAVDHRKISVAQTKDTAPAGSNQSIPLPPAPVEQPVEESAPDLAASRIIFVGHQVESDRAHRVRVSVSLEWDGETFEGEASGADLPRSQMEALATATLRAVESVLAARQTEDTGKPLVLSLDGVKLVDAFDRLFVLVAVHALQGRKVFPLAGAAAVDESRERAVILSTLQATDRWARGQV